MENNALSPNSLARRQKGINQSPEKVSNIPEDEGIGAAKAQN